MMNKEQKALILSVAIAGFLASASIVGSYLDKSDMPDITFQESPEQVMDGDFARTDYKTACIETHQTLNRKESQIICGDLININEVY